MKQQTGFTLIELAVTVAVLAVLAGIAFPSFVDVIRQNRVATATNDLNASLAMARSEAIRNNRGAGVCASSDGSSCSASDDWAQGWMVWGDNGDGTFDASNDTVISYSQSRADTMVITGPGSADAVVFDRRGRMAAQVNFNLQPDECNGKPMMRTLRVSMAGQISKASSAGDCL